MRLYVETIPHNEQRYNTVGDWWKDDNGTIQIRVSDTGNEKYNFLIALHELVEQQLCEYRGVSEESVTAFDKKFTGTGEPGDDPKAPYQLEHGFATGVERLLASALNIKWKDYETKVDSHS